MGAAGAARSDPGIDPAANGSHAGKIEYWCERPESGEMPAEGTEGIKAFQSSSLAVFSFSLRGWKFDVKGSIEVLEGNLGGGALSRCGVMEIYKLQVMETVEERENENASQTKATCAVVENGDRAVPLSVPPRAHCREVFFVQQAEVGNHHRPRERSDIHENEDSSVEEHSRNEQCMLHGPWREAEDLQYPRREEEPKPEELKEQRRDPNGGREETEKIHGDIFII